MKGINGCPSHCSLANAQFFVGVPFYIVICNEFEHYLQTRLKILMNVIDIALFVLGWGVWLGEANNNVLIFVFLIQFS